MELIPISEKELRKVAKGCGIKYRNKIPSKELKVEISDEAGFCKKAVEDCGISNSSAIKGAIKYALDKDKPSIKRRSDKKIFFVREI